MNKTIQTLKGFRDFLPAEKRARDYVQSKITKVFQLYGFEPIESPTLEYAELLTGKYGDEADKLLYTFQDRGGRHIGLRYDQTVPTARILSQYQNKLPRYFRRFQIQNVFRADKPQRGRYREFTQADADIFYAPEPIADAEIVSVFYAVFESLGLTDIQILINDRRSLMFTIEPFATDKISVFSIIQSIDKLDKLTQEQVEQELVTKGLDEYSAASVIRQVREVQISKSLAQITQNAISLGIPSKNITYSPTLARGLDYYTGLIFEAVLPTSSGSLGAGGRYDNLIKNLGGPNIPAVGFGLGFDRIIEAVVDKGFISHDLQSTQVLVTLFDQSTVHQSLSVADKLRQAGISTMVCPCIDKFPKQLDYANKQNIPHVIIIGPDEAINETVTLKNMLTREQQTLSVNEVISHLTQKSA